MVVSLIACEKHALDSCVGLDFAPGQRAWGVKSENKNMVQVLQGKRWQKRIPKWETEDGLRRMHSSHAQFVVEAELGSQEVVTLTQSFTPACMAEPDKGA